MARPRLLTGKQLLAARAWYELYCQVGNFKSMAGELGVHEKTLRNAVQDRYKGRRPGSCAPSS